MLAPYARAPNAWLHRNSAMPPNATQPCIAPVPALERQGEGPARGPSVGGKTAGTDRPAPLDILIAVMHRRWDAGEEDGAVEIARIAAPFLHPRRATPERGDTQAAALPAPERLSDAELHRVLRGLGLDPGPIGAADCDPGGGADPAPPPANIAG